MKIHYF